MDRKGEIIGEVREMQKEGKGVSEAAHGEQLAISVDGAICGKTFSEGDSLYVYITKKEADELIECCGKGMPADEKLALQEILSITSKPLF